jgi:asparagine synthetase B (glutamine-hydrolysing)
MSPVLQQGLCNRGPDSLGTVDVVVNTTSVLLTSTVLSLRGDSITKQPFVDSSTGSVLCWNGEAWRIGGDAVQGNDGAALFSLLQAANHPAAVLGILRSVEGPFAFVYLDKPAQKLYYGRDRLGRRSLLRSMDQMTGDLAICSISESTKSSWLEVAANAIHVVDLSPEAGNAPNGQRPWPKICHNWAVGDPQALVSGIGPFNMADVREEASLPPMQSLVQALQEHLTGALRCRVLHVPPPPRLSAPGDDTRIAILFSGGLDCTVLARLIHDQLPQSQGIDLLNVAFENPRIVASLKAESAALSDGIFEACPDRITGRKSFAELLTNAPDRMWRFVAVSEPQPQAIVSTQAHEGQINVPFDDMTSHRSAVISLMHPHNTEMDLSIAAALFFAARGKGIAYDGHTPTALPHHTPARVLVSGLGADELFGGYHRHAAAFARRGYAGLASELKLDVSRIGERNLGRDDRVMAYWGREVRFPFLDESLMRWAMALPAWAKCDFRDSGEDPDSCGVEPAKRVLRLLAVKLGMHGVAKEKKRAVSSGPLGGTLRLPSY